MKKLLASSIIIVSIVLGVLGCSGDTDKLKTDKEKVIPKIPHQITDKMANCADCHKDGKKKAKKTKHINRPNCTECHKLAEG